MNTTMTPAEAETLLPNLTLEDFTDRRLVPTRQKELIATMLACKNGWVFVGWNKNLTDFSDRRFAYACMFDHPKQSLKWYQLNAVSFCAVAALVKEKSAR